MKRHVLFNGTWIIIFDSILIIVSFGFFHVKKVSDIKLRMLIKKQHRHYNIDIRNWNIDTNVLQIVSQCMKKNKRNM